MNNNYSNGNPNGNFSNNNFQNSNFSNNTPNMMGNQQMVQNNQGMMGNQQMFGNNQNMMGNQQMYGNNQNMMGNQTMNQNMMGNQPMNQNMMANQQINHNNANNFNQNQFNNPANVQTQNNKKPNYLVIGIIIAVVVIFFGGALLLGLSGKDDDSKTNLDNNSNNNSNNSSVQNSQNSNTNKESSTPENTVIKPGDTLKIRTEDYDLDAKFIEYDPNVVIVYDTGVTTNFVAFAFEITNNKDEVYLPNLGRIKIYNSAGTEVGSCTTKTSKDANGTLAPNINAKQTSTLYYMCRLSSSSSSAEITNATYGQYWSSYDRHFNLTEGEMKYVLQLN